MSSKGGAGDHRTKEQREADLKRVAELRMQGWLQETIAQEIGITQQQVSRDLKELRKRWQKETNLQVDLLLAEEIAKLGEVERTCWEAFEHSARSDSEGNPSPGDPRFLNGILRCIEKRVELLGIKPPSKVAPPNPKGDEPYQQYGVLVVPAVQSMEEWLKGPPEGGLRDGA